MTEEEKRVATMFADAWNEYLKLENRATHDDQCVAAAVNAVHSAIRGRVALRMNPEFWTC